MSVLHVAAMPFPSVQGTQAAIRAILDVEHEASRAPALLTYAHGGYELDTPWPLHRIADLTRDRSLRSGPSIRKVVADGQLALAARRLARSMRPNAVVAHHVEAASAVLAARTRPFIFFAHTALAPELPTYFPARTRWLAERAGGALDVALARRADGRAALSPRLAKMLESTSEREVRYVPLPWQLPAPIDAHERACARKHFDFSPLDAVFLYAGNLDAYQGVSLLVEALSAIRARRPDARLLVATESDRVALEAELRANGCADRVRFAPLGDEAARRAAHAAADAAWVPRAAEGGLPIKLLDALARGVPTVATRRATAGLSLDGAALVAADDDAEAFAACALIALEARESAAELGRRAREYMRRAHSPACYLEAIDSVLDAARGTQQIID